jgi:hypothetical protein
MVIEDYTVYSTSVTERNILHGMHFVNMDIIQPNSMITGMKKRFIPEMITNTSWSKLTIFIYLNSTQSNTRDPANKSNL